MEFFGKLVSQSDSKYLYFMLLIVSWTFFCGLTTPIGPRPLHCQGVAIILGHTTNGDTSLDE